MLVRNNKMATESCAALPRGCLGLGLIRAKRSIEIDLYSNESTEIVLNLVIFNYDHFRASLNGINNKNAILRKSIQTWSTTALLSSLLVNNTKYFQSLRVQLPLIRKYQISSFVEQLSPLSAQLQPSSAPSLR